MRRASSILRAFCLISYLTLTISGCGGSESPTTSGPIEIVNNPPSVTIADLEKVYELDEVILIADAKDTDGLIESYFWQQTSGPAVDIKVNNEKVSFIAPSVLKTERLSFSVEVKDNDGATAQTAVEFELLPQIWGYGIDDAVANAKVELLSLPTLNVLQSTNTNNDGRFSLNNLDYIPDRFLIKLTGGTIEGVDFVGEMIALCDSAERHGCHITPISSVIAKYAASEGELLTANKAEIITVLSEILGVDIRNDPFIEQAGEKVDLIAIREYLNHGANLEQWLATIIEFVETGHQKSSIEQWFLDANLAPKVSSTNVSGVSAEQLVSLYAEATDADGAITQYFWKQISGTSVILNNPHERTASFSAPTVQDGEILSFEVIVTDDDGAIAKTQVEVEVLGLSGNVAPTVDAGKDKSVQPTDVVSLNAQGSDVDGIIVAYMWRQIAGTSVELQGAHGTTATFVTPTLKSGETLSFEVEVVDDRGAKATDTIDIFVVGTLGNTPPSADAGVSQRVEVGATVVLTGSAIDGDGEIVAVSWTQTAGPEVTLSSSSNLSTNFIAPSLENDILLTFQLTVTDDGGAQASDTVNVAVVGKPVNLEPVVNAGADQSVYSGAKVNLQGIANDEDGEIISYQWTQTSGTLVELLDSDKAIASFTAPQVTANETLMFLLTVVDDDQTSSSDSVAIEIQLNLGETLVSTLSFPDSQFNRCIEFKVAAKPSLTVNEVVGIDCMVFAGIQSIEGIEVFANLTWLNLQNSADVNLTPLTKLPKFNSLGAFESGITDIAPLFSIDMNVLTIGSSNVQNIDQLANVNWQNLTRLEIQDTNLTDISFLANFPKLTRLNISYNAIDDVSPVGQLVELRHLGLAELNNLNLSFLTNLNKLTMLDISSANVTDISALGSLNSLTNLFASNNKIEDISVLSNLTALQFLNLKNNRIVDISSLEGLLNPYSINLDNNLITDLSVFSSANQIAYLYLRYNPITDISPLFNLVSYSNVYLSGDSFVSCEQIEELKSKIQIVSAPHCG